MSENMNIETPEILGETPVQTPLETPAKRLAECLLMLRAMTLDTLEEHREALMDLPEVFNHLQMTDKYLFNAIREEARSREPVPEVKTDLPDLAVQLAAGEKFLLRTLAKTPKGMNRKMLGNENLRLIEWALIEENGDLLTLTDRGAQVNALLGQKPAQRPAVQALAS